MAPRHGGGVMALGGQLMGAGLSMPQIQAVSKEMFAVGREKVDSVIAGARGRYFNRLVTDPATATAILARPDL